MPLNTLLAAEGDPNGLFIAIAVFVGFMVLVVLGVFAPVLQSVDPVQIHRCGHLDGQADHDVDSQGESQHDGPL